MLKDLKNKKKYNFSNETRDLAKAALSKLEGHNHKHPEGVFADKEFDKIKNAVKTEKKVKKVAVKAEKEDDQEMADQAQKALKKLGVKDEDEKPKKEESDSEE